MSFQRHRIRRDISCEVTRLRSRRELRSDRCSVQVFGLHLLGIDVLFLVWHIVGRFREIAVVFIRSYDHDHGPPADWRS